MGGAQRMGDRIEEHREGIAEVYGGDDNGQARSS